MFYYKHIDIDNSICEEVKQWGLNNIQTSDIPFVKLNLQKFNDECPLFLEWTKQHNIKTEWVVGIKVNAHNGQIQSKVPHTDLRPEDQNYALNFPVKNCDQTYTCMYNLIEGDEIILRDNAIAGGDADYKIFSADSKFEEVAKFYLNKPTLFDTNIPHKVFNNTDHDRLSLSLRFESNPKLD